MNVGDEEAAGRGTGERIGADAEPADVLVAVLGPELLGLLGNRCSTIPAVPGWISSRLTCAKVATRLGGR